MLGKFTKMSVREAMIDLVGWKPGHGEQPRWLKDAIKATGLTGRTIISLWRNEIEDPDHWAKKEVARKLEIKKAREEAEQLANQFSRIAE